MKLPLRFAVVVSLAAAASCGHNAAVTQPATLGTPLAFARANSIPQTVHVIPFYSYLKSGYDVGPGGGSGFIGSPTALYGATNVGGSTTCSTPFDSGSITGCGIVYRLVPSKGKTYKLATLHTFQGQPGDGAASFAKLLADKGGNLYGTTFYGGTYDAGTLFKLHPTKSGYSETIVHSFGYGQDAAYPISGVIDVNGVLYGTTLGGGTYTNEQLCKDSGGVPNGTCGTVYSVNPATGVEQVLHSFGKASDGANPFAELLDVGGTLYGTTDLGGSTVYCGTIFSIGADGNGEKVLHSFLNTPRDGCNPFASLIDVNGTLYGTTCCGGGYYCSHCEGTLFSYDLTNGQEAVLHKFGNGDDGSEPVAALTQAQGVLYGTTTIGGGTSCVSGDGCGVIFGFAPSPSAPAYKSLYQFSGGDDGAGPDDPLLYSHRAFYLTTRSGGKKGHGTGVKLTL